MALPGVTIPESGLAAVLMLAPAICITHFVYRYNLFDVLIPRRVVFALALGIFSAAYLSIVWRVGQELDLYTESFSLLIDGSVRKRAGIEQEIGRELRRIL